MDALIALHKPPVARGAGHRPATPPSAVAAVFTTPELLVPAGGRIVVVAPHPDDEVLALGATVAQLAHRGHAVHLYAVTDGEGSHPGSAAWPAPRLRDTRPLETQAALACLGIGATVERLGLPDGQVAAHEKDLAGRLQLRGGDTVFVTWRHDGHADHEACARAALASARTVGARCIEYPVWALVPGHAAHAGLQRRALQRITVADAWLQAKQRAVQAFSSQLGADGPVPPVLHDGALGAWSGRHEWVMA